MPMQVQHQWREYVSCSVCCSIFNENQHPPVSLVCSHTVCKACLMKFNQKKCPIDQTAFNHSIDELPVNYALLQLVGVSPPNHTEQAVTNMLGNQAELYADVRKTVEELALFLKPPHAGGQISTVSLPMQRKLFIVLTCQLMEEEGQVKIMRAARSLGERAVTELLLLHQNPQQLAPSLWAAVRNRGCQFLGPAMQEEVLKLILLAQEEGHPLSRKVLVLFVVQRLEPHYSQASKTAIGHVVQLLYRASCFKVMKRDEESSLMQLKEEFRTYEALRREHDTQIVQIALEAGLRITPDQWSSLLYGDNAHKSHMQSIIDKLQTAQSFSQSVSELMMALQRSGDPTSLSALQPHLELLTNIDLSHDGRVVPSWDMLKQIMNAVLQLMQGFDEFMQQRNARRQDMLTAQSPKYKTSLCRDLQVKGKCPRGNTCSFAHTQEELERYRTRTRKLFGIHPLQLGAACRAPTSSALTPQETAELAAITKATQEKLKVRNQETELLSGGSSGDLPSVGRMLGGRNSRFDITTVTQGQGLPYAESFQQQQAYAQRVLRQGHRCPSGGELTQYYQMQGAMHGTAGQQPNGADGLHGIYGRGDYTEPVGGYATWHPNGSNLPRRALTDLFPTLASSGIQSQSADRVHGSASLHLNDLSWHHLDRLPESQDASPIKSDNMASFDSGWNMPSSGSHASFFTGDDHQRSLSPQHDNISDDSGLDIDRHYHTWSSDESHARPSILPKDRFHPTSAMGSDVSRLGKMMEGKDDFVPWDERGGRFGPIARYAKTDRFSQPPIMESGSGFIQGGMGGNMRHSPVYGRTLTDLDHTSANVYQAAANYMDPPEWSCNRTRSDSMPSNLRSRSSQQQQQQASFVDHFQELQLAGQNALEASAGVSSMFPDLVPVEFGTYGFQQRLSQALDKQLPSNVYSVPEMSSLTMQSLKHPQADYSFMH